MQMEFNSIFCAIYTSESTWIERDTDIVGILTEKVLCTASDRKVVEHDK
jgi:hypothetical protein